MIDQIRYSRTDQPMEIKAFRNALGRSRLKVAVRLKPGDVFRTDGHDLLFSPAVELHGWGSLPKEWPLTLYLGRKV